MSSCPNCHQTVAPTDDICENCGVVLSSMIATPTFVAAPSASLPTVSTPPASGLNRCPNCQQPVNLADDVCDHCGMVLTAASPSPTPAPAQPALPAAPPLGVGGQDTCPNCGRPRIPGARFCRGCGANLMGITGPAGQVNPSGSAPSAAQADRSSFYHLVQRDAQNGDHKYTLVSLVSCWCQHYWDLTGLSHYRTSGSGA